MDADTILNAAILKADQVAARHLEFILSSGEKGESATARLARFEQLVNDSQDKIPTLQTELIVLGELVQVICDEIKRLEKPAHERGK